jgi:hypothetical protein
MALVLGGCATGEPSAEAVARAECKTYSQQFEHRGRMKDACLISRGYEQVYDTMLGAVKVRSKAEPRQLAEVVANDLKACNDETSKLRRKWGGSGIDQFTQCMGPRGYPVTGLR